jgi:hypothetical protein
MSIFDDKEFAEDVNIDYVIKNFNNIKMIKDPSEKIKLAAIKAYPYSIEHINNPSEELQLAAVIRNVFAIKFINNQFESVKLYCANNIFCMPYIQNPSEEIQLKAIRNCKFYNEPRYTENIDYIIKHHITSLKAKELYRKMIKVRSIIK